VVKGKHPSAERILTIKTLAAGGNSTLAGVLCVSPARRACLSSIDQRLHQMQAAAVLATSRITLPRVGRYFGFDQDDIEHGARLEGVSLGGYLPFSGQLIGADGRQASHPNRRWCRTNQARVFRQRKPRP
jgi:hypothetical protein